MTRTKNTPTKKQVSTPTRTINPLHMEDLDPRRFEDLIRQLAHGFRPWRMIEPTGRLGNDEGIDIRAEEVVATIAAQDEDEEHETLGEDTREWRIQCKRYKRLHPKGVAAIVDELVPDPRHRPYGLIVAAATDVSADALSAFHTRALALGVHEHHFWSRSVIEDLLYRPENAHLLFAYFGISLAARRRSLAATIRAEVTLKKQLKSLFEKDDEGSKQFFLVRDPNDIRYPRAAARGEAPTSWVLVQLDTLKAPGRIVIAYREHPAWVTPDRTGWDALFTDDLIAANGHSHLRSLHGVAGDDRSDRPNHDLWDEYVPEPDKAFLKVFRYIDLSRVIAVDPLGDGYYPVPQLFVEFRGEDGPFTSRVVCQLEVHQRYPLPPRGIDLEPSEKTRVHLFADPLPTARFPVDSRFDHGTYPAEAPLSSEAAINLGTLLTTVAELRRSHADSGRAPEPSKDDAGQFARFRSWRDSVAVPVFSAVIERLRAAGEFGRVVVRSSPDSPGSEPSESVELRIAIKMASFHNPEYLMTGHIRVAWNQYRGFAYEASPMRSNDRNSSLPAPIRTLEELTRERLEQEIGFILERIIGGR